MKTIEKQDAATRTTRAGFTTASFQLLGKPATSVTSSAFFGSQMGFYWLRLGQNKSNTNKTYGRHCYVHFVPKADIATYSITSSASDCIELGIVSPSVLAVPRLMSDSNLVGCSTGTSPGFSPLRIRAT